MPVAHKVEVTLSLPEAWFALPAGPDADVVAWATDTAYRAWRLRADAGVPESAVAPGAGERLVVELAGLAVNVREQVDLSNGDYAAAWVPAPEFGVVSAVVLVQSAPRSPDRSPERFAEALLAHHAQQPGQDAHLHTQRLEGEVPAGLVRGLHTMLAVAETETGVAALEERVSLGVFPDGLDTMVEVLFVAERVASFEDMPAETLALLSTLAVRVVENR